MRRRATALRADEEEVGEWTEIRGGHAVPAERALGGLASERLPGKRGGGSVS